MAVSNALTVLLVSLIISTQELEQRPSLGGRSKRDTLASSMFSTFTNLEKRLAAVEATAQCDNSTEERLVQLKAEMTKLQDKMSALDKRLEDNLSAVNLHNNSVLAIQGVVHSVTELVAALEQNSKSTMRSVTEILASMISTSETRLLAQLGNNTAELNASIAQVKQTTKELATHMSTLENKVHSGTEQMAASEQSLKSTIRNATENLASMMHNTKAQLLAKSDNNMAVVNASIARVVQTTKELATHISAVDYNLENATSLHTEETKKIEAMLEDLKNNTKGICSSSKYRRTCQDYYHDGHMTSGVYSLQLEDGQGSMDVYCDMSKGPGWVVFQRRQDGSVDFYRNWTSYEDGFGDLSGEFWLGNRNIHRLTRAGLTQLRVDLQAWDGSTSFASYSHFSVGDANSSYTLSVCGCLGTAGDSLAVHSGQKFSTFDHDLDTWSGGNCAQDYKGAWWYYSGCHTSNLNGLYGTRGSRGWQYVTWYHWLDNQSLQRTELKLK